MFQINIDGTENRVRLTQAQSSSDIIGHIILLMPLKVSLKGTAEPSPRDSRALSKIGQGVSHRAGASNTDSGASQLEARAGHKEDRPLTEKSLPHTYVTGNKKHI